jgi:hypothetical protein
MDDDVTDLIGNVNSAQALNPGALGAMTKAIDDNKGDDQAELDDVRHWTNEYKTARAFDKAARIQYARDRKYAAGLADPNWASDANLIGAFIDILVSFLFAQNPDVSVRPAQKVDAQPDDMMTKFAATLELVVSELWKQGKLKKAGKKWVRAALTVGMGWIKATFLTQQNPAPQIEQSLSTYVDQLARIDAAKEALEEGETNDNLDQQKLAIEDSIKGLEARKQKQKRYGQMCDFVRSEDIQVSLDVSDITDYPDADWVSCDMYVRSDTLPARFKDLDEDDIKEAAKYYQRNVALRGDGEEQVLGDNAQDVGQYTQTIPDGQGLTPSGSGKVPSFAKIIEIWDRKNQLVRTIVDGVKTWAVDPYPPPQATERFYPFFGLYFYPVDGQRHPQSLPWRLRKLQDEYSGTRSAQVLTRQRSVPGVMVNAGSLPPDELKKVTDGVHGEYIPLQGVANTPVQNMFAAKPQPTYNPQLYDVEPTVSDMERISGVQEALSQGAAGANEPKTATEASIQHQGFQSRTGNDRDNLEENLDDLATYTAECSIQECPVSWVNRVCGPNAFWLGPNDQPQPTPDPVTGELSQPQPTQGMDVEDLLTMVEVDIDAGTTGKPNSAADKANWSTILPLLEKSLIQIRQAQVADPGLADALIRVLRETLKRMDDRLDIDEFIPKGQPTPPPPPPPPAPQVKVNVSLTGALPSGDAQLLLEQSGDLGPQGGPGAAPGAPPGQPAPAIPGMPTQVAPGIPMPPLSLEPPKPPAGTGPPPVKP